MNFMSIMRSIGRGLGLAIPSEHDIKIVRTKTANAQATATRFISASTPMELAQILICVKDGDTVRAGAFTLKDPARAATLLPPDNLYGPQFIEEVHAWMAVMEGAKGLGYGLTPALIDLAEQTTSKGNSSSSFSLAVNYVQQVWVYGENFSPMAYAGFRQRSQSLDHLPNIRFGAATY